MTIIPKNWASFQHYKDRSPPWIKLHHNLLDNCEFNELPVASRALAPCIWLLASEYVDGKITLSLKAIAFRLHLSETALIEALTPLIDSGFFIDDKVPASAVLAERYQVATPETEAEAQVRGRAAPQSAAARPASPSSTAARETVAAKQQNGSARSLAALPAGALTREPDNEPDEGKQVADKKPEERTLAEINDVWRGSEGFKRP